MTALQIKTVSGAALDLTIEDKQTYIRIGFSGAGLTGVMDTPDAIVGAFANTPAGKAILAKGGAYLATLRLSGASKPGVAGLDAATAQTILAEVDALLAARAAATAAKTAARWETAAAVCPTGYEPVEYSYTWDGWVRVYRTRDGIEITHGLVTDGTPEHFAFAPVAALDADRATKAQAAKRRRAEHDRLCKIAVPAQALAAYRRYRGDYERAEADEDDQAAWSIRSFGPAIEAQGLAADAGPPAPRPDSMDDVIDATEE